jgi:arginine utilization protein RocB
LTRQIFLEKNRPFIEFSGVAKDNNSSSVSTLERNHSPLTIDLALLEIAKLTKLCIVCFFPNWHVPATGEKKENGNEKEKENEEENPEKCEDVHLKDSESESYFEEEEEDILEHLHPAEVHFRVSKAPKNFWNRMCALVFCSFN